MEKWASHTRKYPHDVVPLGEVGAERRSPAGEPGDSSEEDIHSWSIEVGVWLTVR